MALEDEGVDPKLDTPEENVGSASPNVVLKNTSLVPSKTSTRIIFKSSEKKKLKNDGSEVEFEISKPGGTLQDPPVEKKKVREKKWWIHPIRRKGFSDPPASPVVMEEDNEGPTNILSAKRGAKSFRLPASHFEALGWTPPNAAGDLTTRIWQIFIKRRGGQKISFV